MATVELLLLNPMNAAFAEIDITPQLPCEKPGWIVKILANAVDDPLMANVAVLDDGKTRSAIVSLDILSVRWPMAEAIRDAAEKLGIPRGNVLVAATHNHTGPPVSAPGLATKDPIYIAQLVTKVGQALAQAVANLQPVHVGIASGIEGRVSFIRRCIMKDGSVKTHPFGPEIRCAEGAIDPEVGVISIQNEAGKTLGLIVNFTCHPVHGGGEPRLSAGWPGVLRETIKRSLGTDVTTVFLNGALGDTHHENPLRADAVDTNNKQRVGDLLASTVLNMLPQMKHETSLSLFTSRKTIKVPYRDIDGPLGENFKLRQRFAPDHIYETLIAKLRTKHAKRDHALAEIQAIRIDENTAFVSLPAEAFSAIGLKIKSASPFKRTYIIAPANGIIGYVPTAEAFDRGGYETTLSMGSKLAPQAAQMLIETALEQLRSVAAK